jgi:penicillin-binding protein 2
VVVDCRSGDILCLASMPAYDPNSFTDGISSLEWSFLAEDERRPLLNKALNGLYPPAHLQAAVAMALLKAGVDPTTASRAAAATRWATASSAASGGTGR